LEKAGRLIPKKVSTAMSERSDRELSNVSLTAAGGQQLDLADPLAQYASQFHHPYAPDGRRTIYLCGHSLGLQPKTTQEFVDRELADWRRFAVLGHHDALRPWIGYHEHVAAPLASLVGAAESEVVVMNSLTANLHLMMVSFFRPDSTRNRVLIEKSAFPSDRYAVVSQLAFHGLNSDEHLIEIEPRVEERCLREEDILDRIASEGSRLALVLLPGMQYLSGQALNMGAIAAAARKAGAVVGFDLAHSIGNVPLHLHDWNADFAVWCSYKYLNAGPGAIGGCFVHERHGREGHLPRFAGWWGHDKAARFRMEADFEPIAGAEGWQLSNPSILSTAPLLASLQLFERATMPRLREKSVALTGYLERLVQALLPEFVEIITPADAGARGCQLSLRLKLPAEQAKQCYERLISAGVIADWREPDVLRVAPVPLYNSFSEVFAAVEALGKALHR
jgi:kynureninase